SALTLKAASEAQLTAADFMWGGAGARHPPRPGSYHAGRLFGGVGGDHLQRRLGHARRGGRHGGDAGRGDADWRPRREGYSAAARATTPPRTRSPRPGSPPAWRPAAPAAKPRAMCSSPSKTCTAPTTTTFSRATIRPTLFSACRAPTPSAASAATTISPAA